MITVLCIIGYIVMIFVTAIVFHKFFKMDKDDALWIGVIWPFAILLGIDVLIIIPFWWIGDKIIELWDDIENRNKK